MKHSQIMMPSLEDIRHAADLVSPYAIRSPLLRLNLESDDKEIYLKLENL
ncbi:MAG: hypothetical protein GKR93_16340 [Gammaproteobacteria bacterium]|nr:hypothetical protein [Gammaproteobacteria bacterium]